MVRRKDSIINGTWDVKVVGNLIKVGDYCL